MYNDDKELYEINIDKLCYSLENGNTISVEDYIDYKDEIYSIEKLKLTEEQLKETRKEVETLISNMYDNVQGLSIFKTETFRNWVMERKLPITDKMLEDTLKKAITFVPKSQFVKNVTDIIYDKNSSIDSKNKTLKQGVTIFTLKTKEIRDLVNENFLKSLLYVILNASSILITMAGFHYLMKAGTILKSLIGLGVELGGIGATHVTGKIFKHTSSKFAGAAWAEGNYMSKFNKLFKVNWEGGFGKALGIAATHNITAATLEMKLYPKFKIK